MSLLDPIETAVAPYLTYIKLGALALAVVGLLGSGFYAGFHWESSDLNALKTADAQAVTTAVQKEQKSSAAQAAVALAHGIAEGQAQAKIEVQTVTLTKEIPTYVPVPKDNSGCITVGLMRVLRAASSQTDPGSLQLAAGQSDDDCADITAASVAGWFTDFAGASEANSEQLNALEGWVADNHAAQEANQ